MMAKCVMKRNDDGETEIIRVSDDRAKELVESEEGWSYTNKSHWKRVQSKTLEQDQ